MNSSGNLFKGEKFSLWRKNANNINSLLPFHRLGGGAFFLKTNRCMVCGEWGRIFFPKMVIGGVGPRAGALL